jgi:hypothetical protein
MLSPHEFATLMLIKAFPDSVNLDHGDLETLLECHLVMLERLESGQHRFLITNEGQLALNAAARFR